MLRLRFGIFVVLILVACGSQNSAELGNEEASLRVEAETVTLDGDAIQPGDIVAVSQGQRVEVSAKGHGSIDYGDLIEFEVFGGTNLVAPDPTTLPTGLSAVLAGGHLHVTVLDPGLQLELKLGEPMVRTLRTVAPETEFVVCQSPKGATCLQVVQGSVQWEGNGDVDPLTEGQATFAQPGLAPQSPNCPPVEAYNDWIRRFTTGESDETLPEFVERHQESHCDPDASPESPTTEPGATTTTESGTDTAPEESSLPSGEGMTQIVLEEPEIGTEAFEQNRAAYRQRERLNQSFEFFIDTKATTNSDFRDWLSAEAGDDSTKWTELAPDAWLRRPPGDNAPTQATYLKDEQDLPVAGIRWQAAADYCRYHDKRLPTETEWELAAANGYLTDIELARQDWVDEPEAYAPSTPSDRRVLRGTTASETPDPYYRLIVPDVPEEDVARARAGVRCAADEVQPGTEGAIAGGEAVENDDFKNSASGWPTLENESIKIGYHPPSVYHVEPHAEHTEVVVLHEASDDVSAGLSVTTNVFVDSTETTTGGPDAFRFGLVVGDETGRLLALTIKPNTAAGRYDWCLGPTSDELETAVRETLVAGVEYAFAVPGHQGTRHRGESCRDGNDGGRLDPTDDFSVLKPIGLKLSVSGGVATVSIADDELAQVDVDVDPTTFGFFVEVFHMGKAHIHYEDIVVTTP